MTDRGLPIVDGAPACPFVAFDDDRDARATSPDDRHRCYAEIRPAPRALAHQEAYCLSSAFPVCPTFQDWARREAAEARAGAATNGPPVAGVSSSESSVATDGDASSPPIGRSAASPFEPEAEPPSPPPTGLGERNPPRNWAAPPPWAESAGDDVAGDDAEVQAQPPVRGGGLAGSFADRLAGGRAERRPAPVAPVAPIEEPAGDYDDEPRADDAGRASQRIARPGPVGTRRGGRDATAPPAGVPGPSWERPRRLEAYPTLKTRLGLPSVSVPPLLLGVVALAIAAVALFYLPALLPLFDTTTGSGSPTPPASAAASATPAEPTPVPEPTATTYLVQEGDTMSKIANRFGVPLAALIEANRDTIPNPDLLQIGQQVIIPTVAPTTLPDAGASPSPAASP